MKKVLKTVRIILSAPALIVSFPILVLFVINGFVKGRLEVEKDSVLLYLGGKVTINHIKAITTVMGAFIWSYLIIKFFN